MFIERLNNLLNEKKVTKNKFLSDIGLNKSSLINWSQRGTIPSGEILLKIANYFDVSVDYLLGKTDIKKDKPAAVSDEAWDAILKDDNKIKLVNLIMTLDREELLKASQIFDAVFPGLKDSESNSENSKPD